MVFAFLIHTLNPNGCNVLYYRVFTCYSSDSAEERKMRNDGEYTDRDSSCKLNKDTKSSDRHSIQSYFRPPKLFETSAEKKEFLQHIAAKVQMQYSFKVKHALVPIFEHDYYTGAFVKGIFMERRWKKENGVEMPVVWQGIPGLGFVLVCSKSENYQQAHNVLDVITQQLEKHLHFLTNPVMALTIVETVALIVNQYLPGGQLLFMNSRFYRHYEKQLETHLFSK